MSLTAVIPVKRALISVSDKKELESFAKGLSRQGIEILSTGGTRKFLQKVNVDNIAISDYTGYPEIMGGRVKTLHPRVHGAILARRECDRDVMMEQGIEEIDLVVVNLYPFGQTIAKPGCTFADAIENIDIGGPAMIRAAAKNHKHVAVVVAPEDYGLVLEEMETSGGISKKTRERLAARAFAHTAGYDEAIARYFKKKVVTAHDEQRHDSDVIFPNTLSLSFKKQQDLRYGENPHQKAAFYVDNEHAAKGTLATAKQWQGKPLSYNNLADTDAAIACVNSFREKACVIVKHANPCGVSIGNSALEAYQRAFMSDSVSAFGGIIALNCLLDEETASVIVKNQFAEVIVAPEIDEGALRVFSSKKNLRVLSIGEVPENDRSILSLKRISGGILVQQPDIQKFDPGQFNVVTTRAPTKKEWNDLLFAWNVVKYVKSNAIVYAENGQTLGIGAGQMSRVESAKIAGSKARENTFDLDRAVMASDAFFPFRDAVDSAAQANIKAIIQPGGSIRDKEVIAAANEYEITMVFTGVRHFLH